MNEIKRLLSNKKLLIIIANVSLLVLTMLIEQINQKEEQIPQESETRILRFFLIILIIFVGFIYEVYIL